MLPPNPRIFLGTEDIGLCLSALAKGFEAHGCTTTKMVTQPELNGHGLTYDIVRGRELGRVFDYEKRSRIVAGLARRFDNALSVGLNGVATPSYLDHDVFVFFWKPWGPAPVLFPLLRRLGKKIVIYYLGSDVRHISALSQEYGVDTSGWGAAFHHDPLDPKVQKIRWSELYADAIYSVPDQSGLQIRPYYHAFVPLDIHLEAHSPAREVPVVVHSPAFDHSARGDIKGSSYVMRAVEQLKKEGLRFDFKLITGMQRSQVLDVLRDADILVDELMLHGPGALSAEAMMAGCAVATRTFVPPYPQFVAPICAVRPDTVAEGLRRLITDVPYRVELAARGKEWVHTAFDPKWVAGQVLKHLRGEELPHYAPSFYLEGFRPPTRLSTLSKALSLRVTERFRPEMVPMLDEAHARGVVSLPRARRLRASGLLRRR